MTDYKVILTNNGIEKLENAMATGKQLVVKSMVFGDAYGEEYTPIVTQENLKHTVLTKELTSADVSEGVVKFKTLLLSTDPSGDFIELGLLLDDGSLFAVANIPKLEHRQQDSGAVTETEITMVMVAENAQNVTINVSSAIYVSKEYANTYYLRTDGNNSAIADISMSSHKITGLKSGTSQTDAVNVSQTLPIGAIYLYAGVDTPLNAKECDGLSYSRVGDTAELYKTIGTLYGRGDGSLTFNVPNLDKPFPALENIRYVIKYKK
jgi:hypothetical protein